MYRGCIRSVMVTGDHYMTASAVAHSLGIFEKGGKRVVLDMIATKPASEAPTNSPQHASKATAAATSRFGGPQHIHQDLSHAALRYSLAQDSRLMAASSPSPRVTFHMNPNEDSGLAALRDSLQESLQTLSASPAAAPSQQAPAVSAAANACQLSLCSVSCAPAVHAADAAASPAAAIAAAATSAASLATAKLPSPLLASYLHSMGMDKSAGQAQAGSAQAQPALAQAQQVSAQATPLHAQRRFASRYKFVPLHAPPALRHTLDIPCTLA